MLDDTRKYGYGHQQNEEKAADRNSPGKPYNVEQADTRRWRRPASMKTKMRYAATAVLNSPIYNIYKKISVIDSPPDISRVIECVFKVKHYQVLDKQFVCVSQVLRPPFIRGYY